MDQTTEDQFGVAATMNCTCLSPLNVRAKGRQKFTLETVLLRKPSELNFFEVDVPSAEGIECLVDSFLCRKNHIEPLLEIATTNPVEFGLTANQVAVISSLYPFHGFYIHANCKAIRTFDRNGNTPRMTVGNRAHDSIRPYGLSLLATQYGRRILKTDLFQGKVRCSSS